jgi:hypothetical protein
MTRAGRGKVPTIWAVVCTDTDGTKIVFEMHSSRKQAALGAKHWRAYDRRAAPVRRPPRKRRYEVFRYEPAKVRKGRWYRIVRYEAVKARTASRKGGK